jgi:hypothetical protein
MKPEYQKYREQAKDTEGRSRTMSLFWETRREGYAPLFTIKDRIHVVDGVSYPSLKLIYMEYSHIPGYEYEFAQDVFGSWDHWQRLTKDSSLRNVFKEWREELDIKLRAEAIKGLIQASKEADAKGVAAARYLADKGYASSTRGRPSKEEVEREKKIAASVSKDLESDMERLGLSVVNGGK